MKGSFMQNSWLSLDSLCLKIKTLEQIDRMCETCRVSYWICSLFEFSFTLSYGQILKLLCLVFWWVYLDCRVIDLYDVQIAREVLDAAARMIRPGVTTDEIDEVVHEKTIAAG